MGIEHAFSSNFRVTFSCIWSRGLHLTTVRDLNVAITDVNTLAFEARSGVLRPLPNLGEGVENARRAQISLRLTW